MPISSEKINVQFYLEFQLHINFTTTSFNFIPKIFRHSYLRLHLLVADHTQSLRDQLLKRVNQLLVLSLQSKHPEGISLLVRRPQVGELTEYTLRGVGVYEGVARAGRYPTADACVCGGGRVR